VHVKFVLKILISQNLISFLVAPDLKIINRCFRLVKQKEKALKKFPPTHETRLSQTPRKRRLYRIRRQKIANVSRFLLWVAGVSSGVVSRDVMQ